MELETSLNEITIRVNVRVAAGAGSALSDATQQNCIHAPGAICQSKQRKDTGREVTVQEGKKEGRKGMNVGRGQSTEVYLSRIRIGNKDHLKKWKETTMIKEGDGGAEGRGG